MKRFVFSVLLCLGVGANAQHLVSADLMNYYTAAQLSSMYPSIDVTTDVVVYKVIYNTADQNGDSTTASGAMYVAWGCNALPMAVYQHGTVFNRLNVPSRGIEAVGLEIAAQGYAAVAPDYLGMGDNAAKVHPYLHAETQATAALDLIRAAREFIGNTLAVTLNGELFITGYSQGGHAAMGLHRYIEDNNLLGEFNVIASAPLSGPYYLSEMADQVLRNGGYARPSYVPYLIEGMQAAYGDVYTDLAEVYKLPYRNSVASYVAGTSGYHAIAGIFPSNFYQFLDSAFINGFLADTLPPYTNPLRKALMRNDNHNWQPTRPVRMVYCTSDEQVYYFNALTASDTMQALGATDVQAILGLQGGTHATCVGPAFAYTWDWFNSLRTPCTPFTSLAPVLAQWQWDIAPNPSNGVFALDLTRLAAGHTLRCEVLSLLGQSLTDVAVETGRQTTISLPHLPAGAYVVRLTQGSAQAQRLLRVQP